MYVVKSSRIFIKMLSKCFLIQVGKDKNLQVKVVKIHPLDNPEVEAGEKKLEGACDSPSSDKENASQENQRKEPPPREEESRRESLGEFEHKKPSTCSLAKWTKIYLLL